MSLTLCGNIKNPSVLIIGKFHGDEPQGEFLINEYLNETPETNLLMIPALNGESTRVNKNGVDLNRNFPAKNWEKTEKNEYFGGEFPASEEETKFLIKTVEIYQPKAILTLHAPYKVVNYDCGEINLVKTKALAEEISLITGYPTEENIGYPTPGSFGTWAGVERNIPTITLELDENVELSELKAPVFEVFKFMESYKG